MQGTFAVITVGTDHCFARLLVKLTIAQRMVDELSALGIPAEFHVASPEEAADLMLAGTVEQQAAQQARARRLAS